MSVYTDLIARFTYRMLTAWGDFDSLGENDRFLKDNGWNDGTIGVFFQAAAPTGWTQVTTQNGKALRVVSGLGGISDGSIDMASTLAHTHSIPSQADHTHTVQSHTHSLSTDASVKQNSVIGDVTYDAGDGAMNSGSGGAGSSPGLKNTLNLYGGPYATGNGGSHDHGGSTDSQLSSIALAYMNVIFASKDTSSGYTDLTATFAHNVRHVFDYLDQLAENDAYNYARRMPATTVSLFGSATAPTGWTKLNTQNAKALRVVSGAGGGTGGTIDPASSLSLAHTHSDLTSGGAHTHSSPGHKHQLADSGVNVAGGTYLADGGSNTIVPGLGAGATYSVKTKYTDTDGSGTTSSDGAHQHAIGSSLSSITLAYLNVIQASKDSAGASTSYTDYTAFFADQNLLAYQDLVVLANNDAYLKYHTMPSTAVMFFFQESAPLTWTKLITQNDKILRVTSGVDGGTSGGTTLMSNLNLAHTHTIDSKSHNHTFAHTHHLETSGSRTFGSVGTTRMFGNAGAALYVATTGGAGVSMLTAISTSGTITYDSVAHTHGGVTGSALPTIALAYVDVIMCQKN